MEMHCLVLLLLINNKIKIIYQKNIFIFIFLDILKDYPNFNAIHVGAAAKDIPKVLYEKLEPGGRMIIPVGHRHQAQVFIFIKNKN